MRRFILVVEMLVLCLLPAMAQNPYDLKMAQKGDKGAMYRVGKAFYYGTDGAKQDYKLAVPWFEKAAEQGQSEAQFFLGLCYEEGKGISQDAERAIYWYREAAIQGQSEAQFFLGLCYEEGKGISQDTERAVYWFKKSANQGHTYAQLTLGGIFYLGLIGEKNFVQAVYWLQKAAVKGNEYAAVLLAKCYLYGQGVPQSYNQAIYWYKKAAEQGSSIAQYHLCVLFYSKKSTETLHYLFLAYENKDIEKNAKADVAKKISACYRFGVCGATKSEAEADAWNKKAAELGEPDAMEIEKWLNNSGL